MLKEALALPVDKELIAIRANMEVVQRKTNIDCQKLQNSKLFFYKSTKSRTLHFTNIKYLNDEDEIIAGLDGLSKIAKPLKKDVKNYVFLL